jgi:predicted P-loop ATPase
LAECFAFDAMALSVVVRQSLPWQAQTAASRLATDDDTTRLQAWLQRTIGLSRLGRDTTHQAIEAIARENTFHPVRDYLDSLTWDCTERLGHWLPSYAGTVDTPYTRAVGRMFLIGMAARIARPGCKADYVLVLEGPQGILKSQLLAELAGPWFSDSLPPIHHGNKDLSQHLRGKWLIELAELAPMKKAEVAALNAFITRRVEQYRPSYGRAEVTEPRQCVFAGTTNATMYLHDPTGARRFWPIRASEVSAIKPLELKRDRDQLWAEAWQVYRKGAHWWPAAQFERDTIKPEQFTREAGDAWEDPIRDYLKNVTTATALDIAQGALGLEISARLTPHDQHRIAAILQHFGWVPRHDEERRWWEKPP